jgi:hypothetical protein
VNGGFRIGKDDDVDDWGLIPEDDMFHPPETDDPYWTETVWFSWMVPERKLLGYFYPAFRANIGVQFGGVLVVDAAAVLPWELPTFDWSWHLPLTEVPDLRDARVLGGLILKCHEPGRVFQFGYENDDLAFDLTYEAVMKPLLTRAEPPFNHGTHVDQPGRVTGRFVLHGEEMDVDCFAMRDRSWGIRRDGRQPKVGYCHATASPEHAFLSISVDRRGTDGILTGYLMRDGVWAKLEAGERVVERDEHGRPSVIRVGGVDELGRPLEAVGRPLSRQVFTCYPSMFCWNSLVQWELDGTPCFGEDQDIWHPRQWREYASRIGATTR